ncbi:MAG: NAD-binding protein [Candidatus Hodarchaeales archaeon]|jgi:Trk K+ transport system NAD-binding subunit
MTLNKDPYDGSWQDYLRIIGDGRDKQNLVSKVLGKLRLYLKQFDLIIIVFLIVITFLFGFIGFSLENPTSSIFSIIYSILRLFILEGDFSTSIPYELEIARFSAPLVLAYAGIRAVMAIFQDKIQDFELRFMKNHVIICGLGEKGFQLLQDILESNRKVVVIEKNRENPYLIQLKTSKAIVVHADATEKSILRKVRIHEARYIITICGDDQVNVEVAVNTYNLLNSIIEKEIGIINPINIATLGETRKIKCFVHLVNPQLKKMLKSHAIFTDQFDIFDLIFFNSYENASRLVFRNYPVDKLAVINLSLHQVHIVIIGLGRMGQSILLQAAKICHYTTQMNATITVVDKDAKNKLEKFFHEYPSLKGILNCSYEQIDVLSPELKNATFWNSKPEPILFIVCLNNDTNGITTSLSLLSEMKTNKKPILVRLKENAGFTTLLNEPNFNQKNPIYPFGMTSEILSQDILINESLDALAIAINYYWYTDFSTEKSKHQYKDPLALWYSLDEELKESNRQQADHIDIKLRRINCKVVYVGDREIQIFKFNKDELEELSHLEHKRWMAERLLEGWKYGDPRNDYRRENPKLVLWEKLTEEIMEENRQIIRNIPVLLAKYNLEIQKE